ncbi:phage portal protein [Citrobacter cronae]|uniref:phage portal protein n=1 Tax=Citrobacter cronae TaxID=1748967 RepID=UPI00351D9050
MSLLDDAIGVFSPGWKAARLQARAKIRAYEAVTPTRTHKGRRENRSADQLSKMGAVSLREQARWLDNNHDLVIGVFDKLEERVVGKAGIIVEPHPKLMNGKIAKKLADQIRNKWAEWSVRPDVTNQFTRPMLERLMLRTWLRDGEVFAQLVSGTGNGLTPAAGIPFWLEALEPDFIPMNSDAASQLNQGYSSTTGADQGNIRFIKACPFQAVSLIPKKWMRKTCCILNLSAVCTRPGAYRCYPVY